MNTKILKILATAARCPIASIDGMQERVVLINGFSKSYSMTGWRMGYACAPAPVIRQMTKIHQFAIMSAPQPPSTRRWRR